MEEMGKERHPTRALWPLVMAGGERARMKSEVLWRVQ